MLLLCKNQRYGCLYKERLSYLSLDSEDAVGEDIVALLEKNMDHDLEACAAISASRIATKAHGMTEEQKTVLRGIDPQAKP